MALELTPYNISVSTVVYIIVASVSCQPGLNFIEFRFPSVELIILIYMFSSLLCQLPEMTSILCMRVETCSR